MDDTNKHGLSRYIPEAIKREVRQRCGFGCVICGFGFYDYEHFDPDFVDAKLHDPNGMTLLCSQCNQKRARGRLSAHTVEIANRNPKCKQLGFANEMFDFHNDPITVKFAGVTFYNCKDLIMVNDRPILTVLPSLEPHGPMLLSGVFCNAIGQETLRIHENEWSAKTDNWDVVCEGPRITIRGGLGDIVLALKMEVPNGLVIERLNMLFEGVHIKGDKDLLEVSINGRPWQMWQGCSVHNCQVGIYMSSGVWAANDSIYS
ncbi:MULTISPECIES: hypothetical protein [Enterobacter cloacae complex]|jgi:hypothetical protein|uniref:hypothetical protein n=1 Tax=Enterobacter cloacae complex TaxID=354276 RepID=UPI0009080425|nr:MULTISPECIES: hypothetical protein [Enterobacter cloacae complex]MCG3099128.1 hypothetical protein [Enterobacter sp. DRP3]HCR1868718.1 hypothetical protein [Enterobacter hormaechei subsp. xiangfangensis]EMB6149026.1 hypothetical protein [Enterobacter asburiae]MBK4469293.1 hypothetical protein [Enterobacter asburiae]MBK4575819.1 hypothetical protein [Enterobacter asburiae]